MMKRKAITAPKKLLVQITPELRACIDYIAAGAEDSLGAVIERLLRASPEIEETRVALKLQWYDRPTRGNLSRVKKKTEK